MNTPILSPNLYVRIWAALLALLLLTWGLAEINLGPFNVVAALLIALAKMLLVILFFMHVRYSSRLTWLFVLAGFIWLAIMVDLTLSDYLTRRNWEKPRPAEETLATPVPPFPIEPQPSNSNNGQQRHASRFHSR